MRHKIKTVKSKENMVIVAVFFNGIEKEYDIKALYPTFPQFRALEEDKELFNQVKVDVGGYGVSWNDELDLEADEIWENGIETENKEDVDITYLLAESLVNMREIVNMTQKELSEATGIYQADISKIERGLANPSISTLQRLASGMGVNLKIEFTK